jgi:hypothetical protein
MDLLKARIATCVSWLDRSESKAFHASIESGGVKAGLRTRTIYGG